MPAADDWPWFPYGQTWGSGFAGPACAGQRRICLGASWKEIHRSLVSFAAELAAFKGTDLFLAVPGRLHREFELPQLKQFSTPCLDTMPLTTGFQQNFRPAQKRTAWMRVHKRRLVPLVLFHSSTISVHTQP